MGSSCSSQASTTAVPSDTKLDQGTQDVQRRSTPLGTAESSTTTHEGAATSPKKKMFKVIMSRGDVKEPQSPGMVPNSTNTEPGASNSGNHYASGNNTTIHQPGRSHRRSTGNSTSYSRSRSRSRSLRLFRDAWGEYTDIVDEDEESITPGDGDAPLSAYKFPISRVASVANERALTAITIGDGQSSGFGVYTESQSVATPAVGAVGRTEGSIFSVPSTTGLPPRSPGFASASTKSNSNSNNTNGELSTRRSGTKVEFVDVPDQETTFGGLQDVPMATEVGSDSSSDDDSTISELLEETVDEVQPFMPLSQVCEASTPLTAAHSSSHNSLYSGATQENKSNTTSTVIGPEDTRIWKPVGPTPLNEVTQQTVEVTTPSEQQHVYAFDGNEFEEHSNSRSVSRSQSPQLSSTNKTWGTGGDQRISDSAESMSQVASDSNTILATQQSHMASTSGASFRGRSSSLNARMSLGSPISVDPRNTTSSSSNPSCNGVLDRLSKPMQSSSLSVSKEGAVGNNSVHTPMSSVSSSEHFISTDAVVTQPGADDVEMPNLMLMPSSTQLGADRDIPSFRDQIQIPV